MLSSDSPGTLSLSAKITKLPSFLVTLQALSLFLAKVTKPLTQPNHKSHMQRNSVGCSSVVVTYFPRLPLLPGTLSPTSVRSITHQWVTGISTLQ